MQEPSDQSFEEMLNKLGFSESQKDELSSTLTEAIVTSTTNKLLDILSQNQKEVISDNNIKTPEDVKKVFEKLIGKEKIASSLSEATSEVMEKFLGRI